MTINETVKWFNSIFDINRNNNQEKKDDFGIGLTSDIEYLKQKNSNIKLLGFTQCNNLDVAKKLIECMQKEGFEIKQEESIEKNVPHVFVYLYKKELQ